LLISSSVSPWKFHINAWFFTTLNCWQQTSYSWIVSRWCPIFFPMRFSVFPKKSTWIKPSSQLHLPDRAYPAPESWRAHP
jgi:hypothetical protein